MILTDKNKNQNEETNLKDNTKQADFSLLRMSIEKDFQKTASHTAHEIRNPLSAMELHSKIISKRLECLDKQESLCSIQNSIDCILNSIEVLKNITNGLKNFSKDIEMDIQKANITATAKKAVEAIRPTFDEKNIDLALHQEENIWCEFDESKTQQILFNLLKNALEASCEGDKVDIYFIRENNKISILVKDTGCGVANKNIEKIFLPNFTTKESGSGIGLCESKKIAQAQNGNIKLVSTGKNGSIFELSMPA